MTFINFGNPLNKLKKNQWLQQKGLNDTWLELADEDTRNTPSKVVKAARDAIDSEFYVDRLDKKDALKQKLLDIKVRKNPSLDAWADYEIPRHDNVSGKMVAFPKVNGYMEVPLPSNRYGNVKNTAGQDRYITSNIINNSLHRPKN